MTFRFGPERRLQNFSRWLLLLCCVFVAQNLMADAVSDRRALVGLNLFRTFVTADQSLESRVDQDGKLPILLVYMISDSKAEDFQHSLQERLPKVRHLATRVEVISLQDLLAAQQTPAAVFVSDPLNDEELEQLVEHSIKRHYAVFSPFEGDVEAGILGGVSVAAQVRPSLNMSTLRATGVRLKSFYINLARQYP